MRTMISSLLALCGLALLPSLSRAEDFAGPHIEATLGWNHDDKNRDVLHTRGDSLIYGGGAGYDLRFGRVVVGVQSELADTTAKTCFDLNDPAYQGGPAVIGHGCNRSGRSIFAGARLGYVVGEHTLLYALGGYANIREKLEFDGTINGNPSQGSSHADRDGYRAGAGMEQSIARHAFVKAEYRYTHKGRYEGLNQNQIVTALGWRF